MEETVKLYKQILETLDRLEKAGTLARFFNDTPEENVSNWVELPSIDISKGYKYNKEICQHALARHIYETSKHLAKAKYCMNALERLYTDYKSREEKIKHPDVLRFIKEYEGDNPVENSEKID